MAGPVKEGKGRPSKFDDKLLAKLEEGFLMSLTDEECCLYCNINPTSLYRYIDKNPEFGIRKERLKKKPNIHAKENWVKEIKASNYQASKDWLERKSKKEFSLRQEIEESGKSDDAKSEVYKKLADKIDTMKPDEINSTLQDLLNN